MTVTKPASLALLLSLSLLTLGLVSSCKEPAKTTVSDKDELTKALGNANLSNFESETTENDAQVVTSLTNSNVKKAITLDAGTNNVILKYTSVRDKAKNATVRYRTEVTRSNNSVALIVTDIDTGAVVSTDRFPTPTAHGEPTFDSLEDCINDFNCKRRGELLCEANRTCKDQFAALTCCLKNGQCFSVHLVIKPTRPLCQILWWSPNFEAVAFSNRQP